MKVKCVVDDRENLTAGKIYEVTECKTILANKIMYRIKDDAGGEYLYDKENFEIVEGRSRFNGTCRQKSPYR